MKTIKNTGLALGLLLALAGPLSAQTTDLALVFKLFDAQQATVTPPQGQDRQAVLGDRLQNQDVVLTGPGTRAAIRFTDDGSLVRMNPSSLLEVTAEGDPGSMVKTLEMDFGEIWGRVTKSNAENPTFRVETPSGVAAVKGTEFIVRVDESGATTVITLEGVVEFFNDAGTVDVTAGNLVQVGAIGDVPTPRGIQDGDIATAQQLVDQQDPVGVTTSIVEVTVQDANGVSRTLVIELPRDEARALLGGGN